MGGLFFGFINKCISLVGAAIAALLSILPDSPFIALSGFQSTWLNAINWVFPIASALSHLSVYLLSVSIYYGLRVVLKWLKVAGS